MFTSGDFDEVTDGRDSWFEVSCLVDAMPRDLGLPGAKAQTRLCARDTSNELVSTCSYIFQYGRVSLRIVVTVKFWLVGTASMYSWQ